MQSQMKLSEGVQALLRCPVCKAQLTISSEELICSNSECRTHFPIVDGIPVMIDEQNSVFSIEDFTSHRSTFYSQEKSKIEKIIRRLMPSISKNIKARENFEKFAATLLEHNSSAKVLVLGGSITGQGMEPLLNNPSIEIVETDVSFGPRTSLICDAHEIPFEDQSIDGVVVQAVLEHVLDPYKCVEEIHRVLNHRGLVYAETPFMQQVHGGRYDFTRFTHLGHRRLFRKFAEINSGAVCGPGMALAWSYRYFLLSFTKSNTMRKLIMGFTNFTSFCLKYFDYFLIDKPGTYDSASGFYFLGKKSDSVLSDRELVALYKGLT